MKKVYLIFFICTAFFSCKEKEKPDPVYDEAITLFSKAIVEANLNNQVKERVFYESGLRNSGKVSSDSMLNYASFFKDLVEDNFYFDGSTPLDSLKDLKNTYDDYNVKFQEKGFDHFCQALKEWSDLYGKPDMEYASWLKEHDYTKDEFEIDILEVNLHFSRFCKIKSEKEKPRTFRDPNQKYSDGALRLSEQRVVRWVDLNYLKIDPELYEVHISPILWNQVDVDGKKEIMSSVMIYMEGVKNYEFNFIEFKDKNTDKDIGYWSTIAGFEIEN